MDEGMDGWKGGRYVVGRGSLGIGYYHNDFVLDGLGLRG